MILLYHFHLYIVLCHNYLFNSCGCVSYAIELRDMTEVQRKLSNCSQYTLYLHLTHLQAHENIRKKNIWKTSPGNFQCKRVRFCVWKYFNSTNKRRKKNCKKFNSINFNISKARKLKIIKLWICAAKIYTQN